MIDEIVKSNKPKTTVRYQIAFYEQSDMKMLGGFDIDREDIEEAVPNSYDDIDVDEESYEVQHIRRKYRPEHNTVIFCVFLSKI